MMIQSTILTPTLPSQDQEEDPVCAKSLQSEKSRQPNHNRVRICKPNMKVLAHICLNFSLPPSLSRLHLDVFPTSVPAGGLCPSSPPRPQLLPHRVLCGGRGACRRAAAHWPAMALWRRTCTTSFSSKQTFMAEL